MNYNTPGFLVFFLAAQFLFVAAAAGLALMLVYMATWTPERDRRRSNHHK